MEDIIFKPIGLIYSPFKEAQGMPIQTAGANGIRGTVVIDDLYKAALKDLEGFSHIILLYYFHCASGFESEVIPFLDDAPHGLFATRAPKRPNPIGLSVVKLNSITENILHIEDIDVLDGTPLLDIKPYIPAFDVKKTRKVGWFAKSIGREKNIKADNRFLP